MACRASFPNTRAAEGPFLTTIAAVEIGGDGEIDDGYQSPFVEINERVDAGEALLELARQLDRLPDYRYAWRWAFAALHAAVQAAIVVSIAGSAKIGAMTAKDQAAWMTAYDEGRWDDLPDERTDNFMPLYTRMKRQFAYAPGDDTDWNVELLHRLRNHVGHIRPESLLAHPLPFVEMTASCLPVIRFLLIERDDMWWLYPEERQLVETELGRAEAAVVRLRTAYSD
jgi:hypothetical protein